MIYITRLLNLFQIVCKYIFSIIFRKVWVSRYPFAISIEPTNYCQLACAECPTGTKELNRHKGYMNIELYEKLIQSVHKHTFYINLYFQGEPLLHPQIEQMIAIARKYRMYVVLSTNGQLLNKEMSEKLVSLGLSKIIISMDGFSNKTYTKYRIDGDVEKVKFGIAVLIKTKQKLHKKHPKIIVQTLVNKYNENEIKKIKIWVKSLKDAKLSLKTMQIYHSFNFLPEKNKYSRYIFRNGKWIVKHKPKNRCFRIWSQCVITHEGNVVPCCFDKNGNYCMGNIQHQSIKEIWKNDQFTQFRMRILNERNNISMCLNCTE